MPWKRITFERLSFPPPELLPSWGSEEKITLSCHIRMVNETKNWRQRKESVFLPSSPFHLNLLCLESYPIYINMKCNKLVRVNTSFYSLLSLFNCALDKVHQEHEASETAWHNQNIWVICPHKLKIDFYRLYRLTQHSLNNWILWKEDDSQQTPAK